MSFIAIDAKADVQGSKKGKLTPAQHAQLNAWCLASKTGILDCLGKCEAKETTVTATNNQATVVFKKGYVVICGRLVECEADTEVIVNTPASGSVTGKIILRYDLSATQEQEFEVATKSTALIQQDLNDNTLTGVYEFELYSYTATPTAIVLVRNQEYVPDIGGMLQKFEDSLKNEGKPLHGYDDSKGTIEERLTRLGFKQGSVALSSGTATANSVSRQGNYVILVLNVYDVIGSDGTYSVGYLQKDFIPKKVTNTSVLSFFISADTRVDISGSVYTEKTSGMAMINCSTGEIKVTKIKSVSGNGTQQGKFCKAYITVGYEANPIE